MKTSRLSIIVLLLYCCFGSFTAIAGNEAISNISFVSIDKRFSLGPYLKDILPVPIELTIDKADVKKELLSAIELDSEGKEIVSYPCWTVEENDNYKVSFIPFPIEGQLRWPSGKERYFVIRHTQSRAIAEKSLSVVRQADTLTISNQCYSFSLAAPTESLSGSVNKIIREIKFPVSEKIFKNARTVSEAYVKKAGKSYAWRFSPDSALKTKQVDGLMLSLEYEGDFFAGNEKFDGLKWCLKFTFYHSIPLVKVDVHISQDVPSPRIIDQITFMKIIFNPTDPDIPLKELFQIKGGRKNHKDLIAAQGPGAFLGIVTPPYSETTGAMFFSPEREIAFLCGILGKQIVSASSVCYLVATDDISTKDSMEDYWWSFQFLKEAAAQIRLKSLFAE